MVQPAADQTQMEGEVYFPAPEITAQANVKDYEALYKHSIEDPQGFWAERAEELEWYKKWDKVLD
ncbi:MAG: acetyl-coenzyme A synthetase N-terminal domain-containing protein, partial [Anaerolineales bacterium]